MNRIVRHSIVLFVLIGTCFAQAQSSYELESSDAVDWPMYLDPVLSPATPNSVFHERLPELWLAALNRPEADLRRRAANAITDSHQRGMKGWNEHVDTLITKMDEPDQHSLVRLALARALIALNAKKAAPSLFGHAKSGQPDMVLLVDPALAKWDHKPARQLWLERISNASVGSQIRLSAIRSLTTVGEPAATDVLKKIVVKRTGDPVFRMAGARAMGSSESKGLEPVARQLADDSNATIVDRIVAVHLLKNHRSPAAIELMKRFAMAEPSVATVSIERLLTIDPGLIRSKAAKLSSSPDATVRRLASNALVHRADEKSIRAIARLLDDLSPTVRHTARRHLMKLTQNVELRDHVMSATMDALSGKSWRGVEQAATMMGQLKHAPAAERVVILIKHERHEVRLASIVALRRIGVRSTLAPMLARARALGAKSVAQYKAWEKADGSGKEVPPPDLSIGLELAQLNLTFGVMGFAESEEHLRKHIPKKSGYPTEARGAAVWALGLLHEGQADVGLAKAFSQRLSDLNPEWPETVQVRRMSAISIGRMNAKSGLGALRKFYEEELLSHHIGGACRWAIVRITGEQLPPFPKTYDFRESGWFLEPIN